MSHVQGDSPDRTETYKGAKFLALLFFAFYAFICGARWFWVADLFSHFAVQYCGVAFTLYFLWCKQWSFMGVSAFVLCLCIFKVISSYDSVSAHNIEQYDLKIVHYNRLGFLKDHRSMEDWLRRENPDIFVIQEAHESHSSSVKALLDQFPYQIHESREDNFGLILASRHEIVHSDIAIMPIAAFGIDNVYVHAVIGLDHGRILSLHTMHPPPPVSAYLQKQRNDDLTAMARAVLSDTHEAVILMGDFNITPYSPYLPALLETSGLKNQYSSYLPFPTWPAGLKLNFLQIPIDYILHKGSLDLVQKTRGPAMGSDHFPVIATYRFKPQENTKVMPE